MSFKDILSKLSQLSEGTEETKTGRVHKGTYGTEYDTDKEGNEKKKTQPEVKRGRGRPKKDSDASGEVKKYDASALSAAFGGGKKPKKEVGKTSVKHSLKEWVQEIENKYVAEAGTPGQPLQVKPMPGASQLVDPATQKVIATGPADKIKAMQGSIAKGEVTMTGREEMAEEGGEKWIQKAIKHPGAFSAKAKKAGKSVAAFAKEKEHAPGTLGKQARLAQILKKIHKEDVAEADIPATASQDTAGAGLGAGRSPTTLESKNTKPDFLDLDKDGNKKESMKKAASDKKKKKVDESMDNRLKAAHHRGKAHALAKESYNCKYDDMEEARMYHEGFKEGLDECYGQMPIQGLVVGEEDVPSTVPGMADQAEGLDEMDMYEMDKTEWMKQQARKTPGDTFKAFGQTMNDKDVLETSMFESWDKELTGLLTEYDTIQEGLTVSISKGQQGAPDSVSVTAQDQEADQLLQLVKSAGLGLFGDEGGQQSLDGQSSPMSLQPADGGEEGDIDVVGDHDGMMALIKKVTGGAGEPDTVAIGGDDHGHDYEEEGGEEVCDVCGHADCQCDHEEGHDDEEREEVDEVESEDQMAYEVAEDNAPDSGAAEEEEEIQDTAQANAAAADSGGATDEELEESEQLDEWANQLGQDGTDQSFEADIEFMTKVISGGLNKQKSTGQTTAPIIAGQNDRMGYEVNESITDWKKLAGLK